MSFRCKFLASQADDQVDEIVKKIEETEKKEAIWMKNRCQFRADDKRRNKLVDDKVENLDENWAREMINFWADNWINFLVSWTDEADELNEADEVEWDHSD